MREGSLEENPVLFGADPTEGIVAVEPVGDGAMRLFLRRPEGVVTQDEPFTPFLLLEDARLLEGFKGAVRTEALSGDNPYRCLALFEAWGQCLKARDHLQRATGEPASSAQAPYLFVSDPVHQHLLLTGKTLFKGLPFQALHRLALDIETACAPGFEFSNAEREQDRILSIALMDSRGNSELLFGGDMEEPEMLRALGERIAGMDPDVIEGHNLFNFDLEYIAARARRHGVPLPWGRGGREPSVRRSRFTVAERIIDYTRMDLWGRHVVDTLFLVQYYDVAARELDSYGLKAAARHFGLAEEGRTYIERDRLQWHFEHDPEAFKRYNLDDVRETLALSELLGYSFFLQARIFPYTYQNIFVRGNATKINALFLREYLRRRASVPKPSGRADFEGGYTDVFQTGRVQNVVHCDVASLYPSLMLAHGLRPSGDFLDVFLPLLRDLRRVRLEAKARAQEARSAHERDYHQALQQTFKVLINSFYGYLGTDIHPFADPLAAAEVTRLGRELIRHMLDWLWQAGAHAVEIDTDGIYFVPPPGVDTEAGARELVARLSATLPEGIDVEMDGVYPAMFSYKRKNYALLDSKGGMTIRGSALRSRGMERYLREFLSAMLRLLLEGRAGEVPGLLDDYRARLGRSHLEIAWVAKTETLTESPEGYRQKVEAGKRNPGAAYEIAVRSGRPYRAGDQISYYVTGSGRNVRVYDNCKPASEYDPARPDLNVAYYEAKLLELARKFEEFLPARIASPARRVGRKAKPGKGA
jgi:DNA polymerase elongation subunit (family B)